MKNIFRTWCWCHIFFTPHCFFTSPFFVSHLELRSLRQTRLLFSSYNVWYHWFWLVLTQHSNKYNYNSNSLFTNFHSSRARNEKCFSKFPVAKEVKSNFSWQSDSPVLCIGESNTPALRSCSLWWLWYWAFTPTVRLQPLILAKPPALHGD